MLQHGSVRAFDATAKPTRHKCRGTGIKRDPDEPGPVNIRRYTDEMWFSTQRQPAAGSTEY